MSLVRRVNVSDSLTDQADLGFNDVLTFGILSLVVCGSASSRPRGGWTMMVEQGVWRLL